MAFNLIAAVGLDGAIGMTDHGKPGLPWKRLANDMQWFAGLTSTMWPLSLATDAMAGDIGHACSLYRRKSTDPMNVVIVGRRTWESLGRPFSDRHTLALSTRHLDALRTAKAAGRRSPWAMSLEDALDYAQAYRAPNVWVAGGARVYAEALHHPACERLYITEVEQGHNWGADTFFPGAFFWLQGLFKRRDDPEPTWHRTMVSGWITGLAFPSYRFGVWQRLG